MILILPEQRQILDAKHSLDLAFLLEPMTIAGAEVDCVVEDTLAEQRHDLAPDTFALPDLDCHIHNNHHLHTHRAATTQRIALGSGDVSN